MNFIHASLPDSDRELFFGPLDADESFTVFETELDLSQFAVMVGAFPSPSQARKNKWFGPVPPGFSAHKIGKRRFWILNDLETVA